MRSLRSLLSTLPLALGLLCAPAFAQPTPAATPVAGGEVSLEAIQAEIEPVINELRDLVKTGTPTESSLAPSLKKIDALAAKYRSSQPEAASQIAYLKGMVYLQVLQDFDQAAAVFKQVQADFPKTEIAAGVPDLLESLAKQAAAKKIQDSLVVGSVFPDFAEKDLAGQPLSIGKYRGQIVLVDFWATWCPPCMQDLPDLVATHRKYREKGFAVVGVNLDVNLSALKGTLASAGIEWANYFDGKRWDNKLAEKYGVLQIPSNYLLDREGKIVAKDLHGEARDREVARLLAATPSP